MNSFFLIWIYSYIHS